MSQLNLIFERNLHGEMAKLNPQLNWEVQERPVFFGIEAELGESPYVTAAEYKALRRNDNGTLLAITKKTYKPMTNAEFTDNVNTISKISNFPILGYYNLKGGRVTLAYLENPAGSFGIGGTHGMGHGVARYMVVGNAFDYSQSFFVGSCTVFMRCTNMFSQISKVVKVRHTKGISGKVGQLQNYLETYTNMTDEIRATFTAFDNSPVTPEVREDMIKYILGLQGQEKLAVLEPTLSTRTQNNVAMLRKSMINESAELGDTMWGLFNGATYYTTHVVKTKHESFGNLYGSAWNLNNRAYEFAVNHLSV